jgi:hypothetical protein
MGLSFRLVVHRIAKSLFISLPGAASGESTRAVPDALGQVVIKPIPPKSPGAPLSPQGKINLMAGEHIVFFTEAACTTGWLQDRPRQQIKEAVNRGGA